MLFSQRKGFKPVKTVLQVDSMDKDLRNSLWNALTIMYWNQMVGKSYRSEHYIMNQFATILWKDYFKLTLDTLDAYWHKVHAYMRDYFFTCDWYEVYDFIEFVANYYPYPSLNSQFIPVCNAYMERELSGYRFVSGKITEITSEEEIAEIEEALQIHHSLQPVSAHLKRALDLLSDRKSPDYRNSIKESISAVEAICKLLTKNPKAVLSQALKEIETKVSVHPALKKAFDNLYGYTSDAEGIRHALLDESTLNFEDAKFMLVSCSAFINYLKQKASKAGIDL